MSTLQVELWRGPDTDTDDIQRADETLSETFAEQLPIAVETKQHGELPLEGGPFDSYNAYLDAFEKEADVVTGAVNVCLYNWGIDEGLDELLDIIAGKLDDRGIISCSETDAEKESGKINQAPWCGYDRGWLDKDRSPVAVVNTMWEAVPLTCIYENFVMHEVLHAVLENREAPEPGNDHSYGTILDGDATPMLTGYVEPGSKNPTPSVACNLDTVPSTLDHTTTLSDCTVQEVERKMDEIYADDQ